jgi:hypothetical protein
VVGEKRERIHGTCGIDVSGKVAIVTGAGKGIGAAAMVIELKKVFAPMGF